MSSFIKVRQWTWKRFFLGEMSIYTEEAATEHQVKSWIGQSMDRGAGGNYDPNSLTSKMVKVKDRRVTVTKL